MLGTVAIIGTFDSKGAEFGHLQSVIEQLGLQTLMIHVGVFESTIPTDISNAEVAAAVGSNIMDIINKDRPSATHILGEGIAALLPRLYEEGRFDGVISLGGSGGTTLATAGMRTLPIGVPKVMVSTMACGDISTYIGASDIIMYPSVVDMVGINPISSQIITNAAHAIAGLVQYETKQPDSCKPLVATTMFGVTTPAVTVARKYLEDHGYEVVTFHATGVGGQTMENLIAQGYFAGVLDFTTSEWCDELFGGVLSAGPHRLEAAGRHNIPQVVSVGGLDIINFGAYHTVPVAYQHRNLYKHNPSVTAARTNTEENLLLGKKIAEQLNSSQSPTALILPLRGVSMVDAPGQPFYDTEADGVLFDTLRNHVHQDKVELIELDHHINDEAFALAAAQKLLELMRR